MNKRNLVVALLVSAVLALGARPVTAGSHLWVINEVFSNADGNIQFIEMKECCGAANEIFLQDKWVLSDTTGNQYVFPNNLPPNSTANKHLLLATPGFAALPGAPSPDHIIVENFFDRVQDELTYWFYTPATLTFGPGDLPTDGVTSLHQDGSTAVNSPTNFAGQSGTVVAPCTTSDLDGSGSVDAADLVQLLAAWGDNPGDPADLNGDQQVDAADLAKLLGAWGPC